MILNEYEESVLRLIQSDESTMKSIISEYKGVLTSSEIKDIIYALKERKYIRREKNVDFAFSFEGGDTHTQTSYLYVLTPLGKNFLANATANFTSFSNITNSNIANNSSHAKQSINISNLPIDMQQSISDLEAAIEEKDTSAITKIFAYIADKSVDVAIAILTGGITLSK